MLKLLFLYIYFYQGGAYEESGRKWSAKDIGVKERACAWMSQGFMSVDTKLGAGRAFLRSLYEQYAEWGVDFGNLTIFNEKFSCVLYTHCHNTCHRICIILGVLDIPRIYACRHLKKKNCACSTTVTLNIIMIASNTNHNKLNWTVTWLAAQSLFFTF